MSASATLDGSSVFGVAIECEGPTDNPRRSQTAQYPGLNGIERLDMGDNGMVTIVKGRLEGNSPAALASAYAALRNFRDGQTHTLVDTSGSSWGNVILESVQPEARKQADPDIGYTQRYVATFLHLTTS